MLDRPSEPTIAFSPTTSLRRPVTAEIIDGAALSAADHLRWRAFTEASRGLRSPFFSAAFTQAVAAARSGVRVAVLRDAADIVGYFPFQFATAWHCLLGAGERVGGHMSDLMGVIGRPGLRVTPKELLRLAGLQSFCVSHLQSDQQANGLSAEDTRTGLAVDITDGWESYWAGRRARSKDFVANTQQKLRKIETALGPLSLTMDCRDPAELDILIAAKRGQYAATQVVDALAQPWARALLHQLLQSRDPSCTGMLSVLRAGDTWIAAHFGISSGALLHHWFPAYNPELSKFSPGRLLLVRMLQEARAHDLNTFDFGEGDQDYKREFATTSYTMPEGHWRRPGLRTLLYRGAQSLAWRLEAARAVPALK